MSTDIVRKKFRLAIVPAQYPNWAVYIRYYGGGDPELLGTFVSKKLAREFMHGWKTLLDDGAYG